MQLGDFEDDVVVQLHGDADALVTVANVVDAAECLTFDWPVASGPRYEAAQETCLAVLDGRVPENDARTAFLLAAEEADVVVLMQ